MRKRQRKKRKMKKREKGKKSTKRQNTEKSSLTIGPAVRSPKSDSWALWTKTCTQRGAYKGFFVSFVTVMPCEVRARNGTSRGCPQSFPASGSFQVSQLFVSGGQSMGVSALMSVLPVNTQD